MNRLLLLLLVCTGASAQSTVGKPGVVGGGDGACGLGADGPVYSLLQQLMGEVTSLRQEITDMKSKGVVSQTPVDCSEVGAGGGSGLFYIHPRAGGQRALVMCDHAISGGGWTLIQQRLDGSVDFFRTWREYEEGFGDVGGEFWLGNALIWQLTGQKQYALRIELEDFEGEWRHAEYDYFRVDGPDDKYKLHLGSYSGDAGDAMDYHRNKYFSTKDNDHDDDDVNLCSQLYKGGWWYNSCHHANLNGLYLRGSHESYANGIEWHQWHGHHYSLKTTRMMIRPKNYL